MAYGDRGSQEAIHQTYMRDVESVSAAFAARELVHDVFGTPLNVADIEAFLAYRPWENTGAKTNYLTAIEELDVSPPGGVDLHQLVKALAYREIVVQRDTQSATWPDSEYPGFLPSQIADAERIKGDV
jgi:hypothetical protein